MENTLYDEKELLRRISQDDAKAFTELFVRFKYKLFGFMYRFTGSSELTEDIIQEVFLKLWNDRHTLHTIDNLNAYIFRMAQNKAINGFKKLARETLALRELLKETGVYQDVEEKLSAKEIEEILHKAIRELPPQQQKVFRLSREEGLRHSEIAERLNISAGTVKNHMIQALAALRRQIRDIGDSGLALQAFLLIIAAFEK